MRTELTSLERFEAQIRALQEGTPQGAAWEKALKGWINGGGHPELTKAWMWGEWPGKLKAGLPAERLGQAPSNRTSTRITTHGHQRCG
jgi:hypothetical protein